MAPVFDELHNNIFEIQKKPGHVYHFTLNVQLLRTVMPSSLQAGIGGSNKGRLNAGLKDKNK